MKEYLVRYSEFTSHDYIVNADSPEEAEEIVRNYDVKQFRDLDINGTSEWDTAPWSVEEWYTTPLVIKET